MKQEPTEETRKDSAGIPAVHGREDVKLDTAAAFTSLREAKALSASLLCPDQGRFFFNRDALETQYIDIYHQVRAHIHPTQGRKRRNGRALTDYAWGKFGCSECVGACNVASLRRLRPCSETETVLTSIFSEIRQGLIPQIQGHIPTEQGPKPRNQGRKASLDVGARSKPSFQKRPCPLDHPMPPCRTTERTHQ